MCKRLAPFRPFRPLERVTGLKIINLTQSLVGIVKTSKTKLYTLNLLRESFLISISMAYVKLHEIVSLQLLGVTFSADMEWNVYIEFFDMSAIKVGS